MKRFLSRYGHFGVSDRAEGQGMVEYGLIIALVAIAAIAGLIILGPQIAAMFTALGSSV